jgi:hypothetical protein
MMKDTKHRKVTANPFMANETCKKGRQINSSPLSLGRELTTNTKNNGINTKFTQILNTVYTHSVTGFFFLKLSQMVTVYCHTHKKKKFKSPETLRAFTDRERHTTKPELSETK